MDATYFEALYESDDDPWKFATSQYERDKYVATVEALPKLRYSRALEVGCSIGVLTEKLAERCDCIVAIDPVEQALSQARKRCHALSNVLIAKMEIPTDWPDGTFDLILLSEVIYYLTADQVRRVAGLVKRSLMSRGDVELVHWTKETDYPLSGDEAADLFLSETSDFLSVTYQTRAPSYRIDLATRL